MKSRGVRAERRGRLKLNRGEGHAADKEKRLGERVNGLLSRRKQLSSLKSTRELRTDKLGPKTESPSHARGRKAPVIQKLASELGKRSSLNPHSRPQAGKQSTELSDDSLERWQTK